MGVEITDAATRHEHVVRFNVSDVPNTTNARTGHELIVDGGEIQWNWADAYAHRVVHLIVRRVLKSGAASESTFRYLVWDYPQWLTELVNAYTPAAYRVEETVMVSGAAGTPYSKAIDSTGR